ncbi:hypothetical protein ACROYT_G019018 [Oculina patagonica]
MKLPKKKMHSWILVCALFSLALAGAMADRASLATVNDEGNFMQDAADTENYLSKVSFDEDPGFNLTISRRAILAARRLSVPIPMLLSGNGVNTFFRHCYCFRRLASAPTARNGFRGWRVLNLVGYVVSGKALYVFYRCDTLNI